jgi:ribosomal protein S14
VKLAPDDPRHGSANGYNNWACRCRPCTVAHTAYLRDNQQATYRKTPCPLCGQPKNFRSDLCRDCFFELNTAPHGTETRYRDCHCDRCRKAAAEGRARRRAAAVS